METTHSINECFSIIMFNMIKCVLRGLQGERKRCAPLTTSEPPKLDIDSFGTMHNMKTDGLSWTSTLLKSSSIIVKNYY